MLKRLRSWILNVPFLSFVLAMGLSMLAGSPHKGFARGAGGATFDGEFCIADLKNLITLGEIRKLNIDLADPRNSKGKIDVTLKVDFVTGRTFLGRPEDSHSTIMTYPEVAVDCRMSDGSIQTARTLMDSVPHPDLFYHQNGIKTYEKETFKSKTTGDSLAYSLLALGIADPAVQPESLVSELVRIEPAVWAYYPWMVCDQDWIKDTLYITTDPKGNGGGSSIKAD